MNMKMHRTMAVCLKLRNFIRHWKLEGFEESKTQKKHLLHWILLFLNEKIYFPEL